MAQSPKSESQYSEKEMLQEERYLWMARAFSLVALLAFIANLLMLFALSGLTPLLRVQPFYLQTQDKDQQVITVVKPKLEDLEEDVLQESLVREYLLARFGISSDKKEVEQRWGIDGIVFAMSETSVYNDFHEKESIEMLRQASDDGLTRDVRILVVNRTGRNPDGSTNWMAEIELIDMSQKISNRYTHKWKIKMEVMFLPDSHKRRTVKWSERLRNPLGFTVRKFHSESIKENSSSIGL